MTDTAAIDASFLAHALIPSQLTVAATRALQELLDSERDIVAPPYLFIEFSSLLRKMVNGRRLSQARAEELFEDMMRLNPLHVPVTEALARRAWDIATLLDQSDTFDAMGYAVAEAYDGEFWTSDQRFANAAQQRGLPRVRFVP